MSGAMGSRPAIDMADIASARRCRGLLRLAENHAEAMASGDEVWDLAVPIDVLRVADGLTLADVLWLVRQGYAEHALETTASRRKKRSFCPGAQLKFTGATCFVLSDSGLDQARRLCALVSGNGASNRDKPVWREASGELSFLKCPLMTIERGDVLRPIVKRFQDLDWPTLVDDPVRRYAGDHDHRRRSAISRLNTRQTPWRIKFFSLGEYDKLGWFTRPLPLSEAAPAAPERARAATQ